MFKLNGHVLVEWDFCISAVRSTEKRLFFEEIKETARESQIFVENKEEDSKKAVLSKIIRTIDFIEALPNVSVDRRGGRVKGQRVNLLEYSDFNSTIVFGSRYIRYKVKERLQLLSEKDEILSRGVSIWAYDLAYPGIANMFTPSDTSTTPSVADNDMFE